MMAYSLSTNSTKNYLNRTTTVEIIVEGWVVYVFATQSRCGLKLLEHTML